MAPAMTLNRMYHCAPSAISRIPPKFRLMPGRDEERGGEREQEVGREAGEHLHDRLRVAGPGVGFIPILTPIGTQIRVDNDEQHDDPGERVGAEPEAVSRTARADVRVRRSASACHAPKSTTPTDRRGEEHVAGPAPRRRSCKRVLGQAERRG